MLTDRFDAALRLAHDLHRDQRRKGTPIPYISHLMAVSALVIEHGGDEDQAIAGLLHDAVEDQGGEPTLREIEARFGAGVAAIIADCTDAWGEPKPPWRARKEAYLAGLAQKPARSLLVALADETHNAETILADHRVVGDAIWDRFNGGREGTWWYYRAIEEALRAPMAGPLLDRYAVAVGAMAGDAASETRSIRT